MASPIDGGDEDAVAAAAQAGTDGDRQGDCEANLETCSDLETCSEAYSPVPALDADLDADLNADLGGVSEDVEVPRLDAELKALVTAEAKLHAEVVRLKAGGLLTCRVGVAEVCHTPHAVPW